MSSLSRFALQDIHVYLHMLSRRGRGLGGKWGQLWVLMWDIYITPLPDRQLSI